MALSSLHEWDFRIGIRIAISITNSPTINATTIFSYSPTTLNAAKGLASGGRKIIVAFILGLH